MATIILTTKKSKLNTKKKKKKEPSLYRLYRIPKALSFEITITSDREIKPAGAFRPTAEIWENPPFARLSFIITHLYTHAAAAAAVVYKILQHLVDCREKGLRLSSAR
jgi:hypothetical protein